MLANLLRAFLWIISVNTTIKRYRHNYKLHFTLEGREYLTFLKFF